MSDPRILFVDDNTDLIASIVDEVRDLGADADEFAPHEVTAGDLDAADLVLLDFDLGDPIVENAESVPPLLRAHDGLGVAQVVRSYYRKRGRSGAVALLSDKLPRLFASDVPHPFEHVVARLHGLEWAFDKTVQDETPGLAERIMELTNATLEAAQLWGSAETPDSLAPLREFLRLPEESHWTRHALALINLAQPPAHSLATASNGLSVVRWLAQRVLPYPGILVDDRHAAVLLGATPDSFVASCQHSGLVAWLNKAQAQYSGAMDEFAGQRWWRSAIQRVVIEMTDGRPLSDPGAVAKINAQAGSKLVPTVGRAVIALDTDLKPYSAPVARHEVVRIRPDDWPVFAEPGYAPISVFSENDERVRHLRSYVELADLELLPAVPGT